MTTATMQNASRPATVTARERAVLRDMARRVADIAADPCQKQRIAQWQRHNSLDSERPMVLAFPEGAWSEMCAADGFESQVELPLAKRWEWYLYTKRYHWERIQDDSVTEATIGSPVVVHDTGWGIATSTTDSGTDKGARAYHSVIETMDDIEAVSPPTVSIDWDETERLYQLAVDTFGDILTVTRECQPHFMFAPLDEYIHWRGIENLFMDLIVNPQMVHAVVSRLTDARIRKVRYLEEQGALTLNNRGHYTGSGGVAYTTELPRPGMEEGCVRARDLWGSATAQIFSEISPAMHEEFALQHEKRYLELFGLTCYGCCEPLHLKLDLLFKHIPNLRRVSISPWADIAVSAEKLGRDYIYSWKPNPVLVSSPDWDPNLVRATTRDFLDKTRGCVREIIMKDTHTCHHAPGRFGEWVRITREEIDRG